MTMMATSPPSGTDEWIPLEIRLWVRRKIPDLEEEQKASLGRMLPGLKTQLQVS